MWNEASRRSKASNFLWVLVMAAPRAPLAASKTSGVVQALSVLLLVANLFVIRRLAEEIGAGASAAIGAAFLTALCHPLNAWSLEGSELALLVPVLGFAVAVAVRSVATERFSSAPYWILGAASLVRPDAAVVHLGLVAGLIGVDRPRRATHLKAASACSSFTAAQTAFRLSVAHGDWLPNTYYLKMTGYPAVWRIAWGIRDLAGFVWHRSWILLAPRRRRRVRASKRGAIVAAVVTRAVV